jgi:hypothetical protein
MKQSFLSLTVTLALALNVAAENTDSLPGHETKNIFGFADSSGA